ncbi:MAG: ubiquinol-cytochrome c reductase iron-sulfur subunit [Gemmatimonadaceae bacterium]
MNEVLDRREFVGFCACALASLAVSGCASLATHEVTPVGGRIELVLRQHPELLEAGGWLKVLPAGHSESLYVLALGDGSFSVLSPICTHLGCAVEIEGERLVCPCHGSTYDRGGKVLVGPAQLPLGRYRAEVSPDGVLVVDLRSRA